MIDQYDMTQPMRLTTVSPSHAAAPVAQGRVLERVPATALCGNCGQTAKVTSGLRLRRHLWDGEDCPGSGRQAGVFGDAADLSLEPYETAPDPFRVRAAWLSRLHCPECRVHHDLPYATLESVVLPEHTRATLDGKRRCPGSGGRASRQTVVPRSTVRGEHAFGIVVLAGLLVGAYLLLTSCFGGDEPQQDYTDAAAASDTVSGVPPQTPTGTGAEDVAYLATLDRLAIPYPSDAGMINVGHSICADLASGQYHPLDLGAVVMSTGQYDAAQAGHIVGAAMGAYCPQFN